MIDHKGIHLFLAWSQLQTELFFKGGKDVGRSRDVRRRWPSIVRGPVQLIVVLSSEARLVHNDALQLGRQLISQPGHRYTGGNQIAIMNVHAAGPQPFTPASRSKLS
jgi:hypothetical protein